MSLHCNPQLDLAFDYVRETSINIFLTGKAGTGKTTFLRQIKEHGYKRLAVVAPTGVAAINAGGMTIHSLFQLPFGLHLPDIHRKQEHRKLSKQKMNLIRSLELLVIDEISMVRADLLDAVDESLRRFRSDDRPFGNVQLLMIGDLHQLPPVVRNEDWDMLSRYYETPYFFGSLALKRTDYVSIELKHIYRQSDEAFIELLNRVRDNQLDAATLQTLNSRYVPNFQPPPQSPYITLTATNRAAFDINTQNLATLRGKSRLFAAQIVGDFPESSYPTEQELEFKVGAQVMFIKNDPEPEKQFFNGKIGRILEIDEDNIRVRCEGDPSDISVVPLEWQNIKYVFNETSKEIEEQVLGTFTQYPLKLAWAITIHKSQGLTFERAIIDAQAAFAHGQVYVALSRCKSFEGIVLRSKIDFASVKTDPVVKQYAADAELNAPTSEQVQQSKRLYQQQLIEELFSFKTIEQSLSRLRRTYDEHRASLGAEAAQQASGLARQAHETLTTIADKFQPHLHTYFQASELPQDHPELRQRIIKAVGYFTDKLESLMQAAATLPKVTDNQTLRQNLSAQFEQLQRQIIVKQACFAACSHGFSTAAYKRAPFDAELDYFNKFKRQTTDDQVPNDVPNPGLYAQLLEYRQQMSEKHGISTRAVLTTDSLRQLVILLPTTQDAIRRIHGIARKRLTRYGKDIESIIRRYCDEHLSQSDQSQSSQLPAGEQHSGPLPNETASATKLISFEMFESGKSIEQIAAERQLNPSTICGHLAHFVEEKVLDIERLLDPEKLAEIGEYFAAHPRASLGAARQYFGTKYSYGELRLAASACQHQVVGQ